MNVAIIGASDKPDRYAYMAMMLLKEKGHRIFPVNPLITQIEVQRVYASLTDIGERMDTITLYVNEKISSGYADAIIEAKPGRIIFNPGAENRSLAHRAREQGITTENACTLVMLRTGQF
jgi:predicted CoA-binding protein